MTAAASIKRPCFVECDSTDANWLDLRRSGIGASEIAAVLGESPWMSPLALYATKIGKYERNLSEVESVYWGHKLEAPIIEAYAERTGRGTRRAGKLLRSTIHPWAICTLDGETWEAANDSEAWPFEVKNTSAFKAGEWVDGPPAHYYLQVQQQLLITGERRATIAALIGGQRMVWADVPRDETTIRRIVLHGAHFWERVLNRDVPAPDGTGSSRQALQALYPNGSGAVVLPATARAAADRLETIKAEIKRLDDEKALIENTVRAALGESEFGALTDGRSFSLRLQHRKEMVQKASSFRVLRLHQPKNR